MSLPARHWRVLVREHDGSESESTYRQPPGEPPPSGWGAYADWVTETRGADALEPQRIKYKPLVRA